MGEGAKLVVSVTLAVSLGPSFLLFRLFGWFFLLSEDSHVVEGVHSEGRGENVQGSAVFGMDGGLESFGEDVGGVFCGGYSPDSHACFHVILFDFVVADVNRA